MQSNSNFHIPSINLTFPIKKKIIGVIFQAQNSPGMINGQWVKSETLQRPFESGALYITDLFQNKSVAHF